MTGKNFIIRYFEHVFQVSQNSSKIVTKSENLYAGFS